MNTPVVNTNPPEVRCGMCGGKCKVMFDPIFRRGARIITCQTCAWSSLNPKRVDPAWYWRLRVWLGW